MQPKYNLKDCTPEEQNSFMKEFQELLNKHSLYFEPVPQFTRDNINSPWKIVCQVFLQKKVEVVEVEKDSISSPFVKKEDDASKTD